MLNIFIFIVCFWFEPRCSTLIYFYYVALFVGPCFMLHASEPQTQTEIFHNFSSNSHSDSCKHDKSAHWNTNSCGFKLTVELFKKGFLTKFEPKIGSLVTLWTSSKSTSHGQEVFIQCNVVIIQQSPPNSCFQLETEWYKTHHICPTSWNKYKLSVSFPMRRWEEFVTNTGIETSLRILSYHASHDLNTMSLFCHNFQS